MVCSVDERATDIGLAVLSSGGNAVDAAVAANAVLTVTAQHMCGLGGDLFALVHAGSGPPAVLNASGRAGSGASASAVRSEGRQEIPHRGHLAAVTVPGCVDGWSALHHRYGTTPLAELLGPAIELAADGFEPTPLLVAASGLLDDVVGPHDFEDLVAGRTVIRTGIARTLEAIAGGGRGGFYRGEFGSALLELGGGQFDIGDLDRSQAEWVDPLGARLRGRDVWTVPPNSQGYLSLAGSLIADTIGWPRDPDSPAWAHLGIEAARAAGFDRPDVLHDGADGATLLGPDRLAARAAAIDPDRAADWGGTYGDGGTMYLCTADGSGMAVSLIQSNARDFGAHMTVGDTGVFLHNRGIGFSLEDGHPAELAPGRRPPHTLSPVLVTHPDGSLVAVLGTMGGDAQPQIVQQLLTRMLVHGQEPGDIIGAPRWLLASADPRSGFDTWSNQGRVRVWLESAVPDSWRAELERRGHTVEQFDHPAAFGHAHLIMRTPDGWAGAADPRAVSGAVRGH